MLTLAAAVAAASAQAAAGRMAGGRPVVGGPQLDGRGVIVNYPAHGASFLAPCAG